MKKNFSVRIKTSSLAIFIGALCISCSSDESFSLLPFQEDELQTGIEPVDMVTVDGKTIIAGYDYRESNAIQMLFYSKENGIELASRFERESEARVPFDIEVTPDGGHIVTGLLGIYQSASEWIYLLRLNTTGDSIWSSKKQILSGYFGSKISSSCNGKFWLLVRQSWQYYPWVAGISETGNISEKHHVGLKYISELIAVDCGYFAIGLNVEDKLMLKKSDASGNVIDSIKLSDQAQFFSPMNIKATKTADGFIITGPTPSGIFVQNLNKAGEPVWDQTLNSPGDATLSIHEIDEGYLIVSGSPDTGQTLEPVEIHIYKITKNGKLVSKFRLPGRVDSIRATSIDESSHALLILGSGSDHKMIFSLFVLRIDLDKLN